MGGLSGKDPRAPYVGGRTLKLKVKQAKYWEGEREMMSPHTT